MMSLHGINSYLPKLSTKNVLLEPKFIKNRDVIYEVDPQKQPLSAA